MKKELKCIMLIDDNPDDNFFHEREIRKTSLKNVVVNDSGEKALSYLREKKRPHSDLIFLDINMPGMNGWDFLKQYEGLNADQKGHTIVIMLTTSDNEDDRTRASEFPDVCAYITKPLTHEKIEKIRLDFFA